MYTSAQVADRIKLISKSRGIQLKDLLETCDMSRTALGSMRNGSFLKSDSLARIALELDCSMDYLMGLTDDPAPLGIKKPLAVEQGDRITRALLDGTGLIGADGTITPEGVEVIAAFIKSNAPLLRQLLNNDEEK